MSRLYDTYVRFMVWLGAEPPPGYEYLLMPPPAPPPKKKAPVKPKPAPRPPSPPPTRPAPLTPQQKSRADALYGQLKARVFGDEATVRRLIEYERKRKPHANLLIWIQDANDRWEHDNRW